MAITMETPFNNVLVLLLMMDYLLICPKGMSLALIYLFIYLFIYWHLKEYIMFLLYEGKYKILKKIRISFLNLF